jgi:hypothetical protein
MTYEERKEEAMKMTLEDLIGGYHSAIDKAENRKNTNISLQYLLDERHLQIEALYDTIQDLTDERDKLKTEVKPEEPKPLSDVDFNTAKTLQLSDKLKSAEHAADYYLKVAEKFISEKDDAAKQINDLLIERDRL